jgi:hypothetical protein
LRGGGQVLEAGQFFAFHLLLFFREDLPVERLLIFQQVPEHPASLWAIALTALGAPSRAFHRRYKSPK